MRFNVYSCHFLRGNDDVFGHFIFLEEKDKKYESHGYLIILPPTERWPRTFIPYPEVYITFCFSKEQCSPFFLIPKNNNAHQILFSVSPPKILQGGREKGRSFCITFTIYKVRQIGGLKESQTPSEGSRKFINKKRKRKKALSKIIF